MTADRQGIYEKHEREYMVKRLDALETDNALLLDVAEAAQAMVVRGDMDAERSLVLALSALRAGATSSASSSPAQTEATSDRSKS